MESWVVKQRAADIEYLNHQAGTLDLAMFLYHGLFDVGDVWNLKCL